ncbi:TPM domain-containing protein [Nitratireductor kimnyeongensis]|uniref:TPM domain-containing protein n=1 Tax=Nitratireductor kimnyeongensis TaxID=430679 RepID=A0ABW0TCC1_9HYPH|nr:YgcG family protein [Nitratireductor kimnyeongensis]QZZ36980.1 YgcG family protein [Nitratireductor kimnyeongensis]
MGEAAWRTLIAFGHRNIWPAIVAGLIWLVATSPIAAVELPRLTGRVVDNAGIVDAATEAALSSRLEAFQARSSDQIVVATIRSLDGEALEPFANQLFRAWGLGQAGEDNGVLLLVALDDRKMRIEVGYGLEGTLTDLHSKLIIENTMVPAFRAGDFSAGISDAVDDIIMVLEGNAAELEARARRNQQNDGEPAWPVILFFIVWGTFFFGGFAMAFLPPMFGRKIGPGRYKWLGMTVDYTKSRGGSSGGRSSGGWSSGGGGFSGGGGSSGGGGASGSW